MANEKRRMDVYRVKSITNREGDTWDWVIDTDDIDIDVSVQTPGATKKSMKARAKKKCQIWNEHYGYLKRSSGKNNYQESMRDGLFEQNVYKKE